MKTAISLFAALLLLFSFVSCGTGNSSGADMPAQQTQDTTAYCADETSAGVTETTQEETAAEPEITLPRVDI